METCSEPESKCAKAPKTRNPLLKAARRGDRHEMAEQLRYDESSAQECLGELWYWIAMHGWLDMAKNLRRRFGLPEDTFRGDTPLFYAAAHNRLALLQWLIEQGVNPTVINTDGLKASDIAKKKRYTEVTDFLLQAEQTFVARQARVEYERLHSGHPYNEQLKLFILKVVQQTPSPPFYDYYLPDTASEWDLQKRFNRRRGWYDLHDRVRQYLAAELSVLSTHCEPAEYRQNVLQVFEQASVRMEERDSFYSAGVQGKFCQTIRGDVVALPFFNLISAGNWLNGLGSICTQDEAYIDHLAEKQELKPTAPTQTNEIKSIQEAVSESDTELGKIEAHSRELIRYVVGWGLFVILITSILALVFKQ